MPKCPDCNDKGVIELLTSTVPCKCRSVKQDEACFGTINGVTLSQPIAFDIETVSPDPLKRSEELVAAMAPGSTFTLEVDVGGDIRTFTGLSKAAVDFVHAGLRAGWDAARVADHLEEMETAAKVNERQKRLADLEAAGYPEHEIEEMAERIEERLFSVDDDGEAVKIIMEEVSALILRKVVRGAMECLIPNIQKMPKGGFATGGVVKPPVGLSYVKESCYGVSPTGREIRSDRQLAKSIITPASATGCGKAEFFKRMYGGKPDLSIDTSQIELRMLAHYQEQYREFFKRMYGGKPDLSIDTSQIELRMLAHYQEQYRERPDTAFPHVPRADSAAPDAG